MTAPGTGETRVPTHCCYCGVQCGLYLRVDRRGTVFGVEPRDHDINRKRLCSKGIDAYQQLGHADRLTTPLIRGTRDEPFRRATWEEALDHTASEMRRIQAAYGPDAVGVLGGGSLTCEKAYLLGKFARVALRTRHVDGNGTLGAAAASAAADLAFGIDRSANPFADMLLSDCLLLAGSNTGQCFPVVMQYVWGARDRGATLIVVDPRETAVARTADVHVALRPGTDSAFFNSVLHVAIRDGLTDRAFLAAHTTGWEEVRKTAQAYPPERAAAICGVPVAQVEQVGRIFGRARNAMAWHARGLQHHTHGVGNCLSLINLCVATGNIGRPGAGYGTLAGQANASGGREHGLHADTLPGGRSVTDPEHRRDIARLWGIDPSQLPDTGVSMADMPRLMRRGEIRGLIGVATNPLASLPHRAAAKDAYDALDFHVQCDVFLSETAADAHVVLPIASWAEDEGVMSNAEARVVKHNKAQNPPPGARTDIWVLCQLALRLGSGDAFAFAGSREVLDELRTASAGTPYDYSGITYERLAETGGISWPCPSTDHPGTPRLFEEGRTHHPDGRFHLQPVEWQEPPEPPEALYPLSLTTGRAGAHYLSGNHTRRFPDLTEQSPHPWVELHPSHGYGTGDAVRVVTRRGAVVLPAVVTEAIRPDTVFVPHHWPFPAAANALTSDARDPQSHVPAYKQCACRIERGQATDEVPGPPPPPTAARAARTADPATSVRSADLRNPTTGERG
ncbi:molybdopterin oxidoreductase family protein [Streptomyces sp. NPDC048639]|uniref:molybdopterin oxidoreductase family protein n=1 Tax=Streptomyces sp. NPDC048639 TaxID=3365581 RepID=UPI0037161CBA